jgi:anti-sigma-K factor RskA
MTREHDAVRGLLAPAAVSAASRAEIARVEAHAQECPVCREDLARLREGADVLALSVPPAEPSPRLKRDLMATVRAEAALRAPVRAPVRGRRSRGWLSGLRTWPAAAMATAAVALLMLGWNVALQTGDPGPGPSAEVTSLRVSGAGGIDGRVLYMPDEDRAIINLTRLPQPGAGEGYELWVIRDGEPVSAGFLQEAGPAETIAVASNVRGADALAVTLEPLTNRTDPTTDPVVAVDLPQRA